MKFAGILYDPASGIIKVSTIRAAAIASNSNYYSGLFMNGSDQAKERKAYAIANNAVKDPERMRLMNSFFFWISWACELKDQVRE